MTESNDTNETVQGMLKQISNTNEDAQKYVLPNIPGLDIQKDRETGLDYFFVDDQAAGMLPNAAPVAHPTGNFGPLPMRTNSDKLLYGTGAAYVCGVTIGGVFGAYRSLRNANLSSAPFKLKLNALLNSTTRYGPWLGNSWGMLTFLYTGIDSSIAYFRDTNDSYNHLASAFLTGSLFKSTAGLRPALLMGTLLSVIAGGVDMYYHKDTIYKEFLSKGTQKLNSNLAQAS